MDRHILTSTRATQNSAKYAAAVYAKGLSSTVFPQENDYSCYVIIFNVAITCTVII